MAQSTRVFPLVPTFLFQACVAERIETLIAVVESSLFCLIHGYNSLRTSIKRPISVPLSPSSAVECYPCRTVSLNYNRSRLFHGSDTGSIPVRDAILSPIPDLAISSVQMPIKLNPECASPGFISRAFWRRQYLPEAPIARRNLRRFRRLSTPVRVWVFGKNTCLRQLLLQKQ